jgi:4-amino-4-deoxy-L-arabinose transferase-like glycosyltransferase
MESVMGSPLIDQALRLLRHQTLYKAEITSPPYVIANYPPIYPALVAAAYALSNLPIFLLARSISVFAALISCGILYALVYHLSHRRAAGVIAAGMLLCHPYFAIWSGLARVDLLALAFSLIALWVVIAKSDHLPWLLLAVLCAWCAIFTRQTYMLAMPLAAVTWLWQKSRRLAIIFSLLLGSTTIAAFGVLNALSNGGFYTHIVVANINQYEIERTWQMGKQLLLTWPIVLGLMLLAAVRELAAYSRQKTPLQHTSPDFAQLGLPVYTLGAVLSALTVGKVGSDINYFLEVLAAGAIWMGVLVARLPTFRNLPRNIILGLLTLQMIWVLTGSYFMYRTSVAARWEKIEQYHALYQQVQNAAKQGQVLSDDYLDMVILAGQNIYYQPFEYGQLYQAGYWDADLLAQEIEAQRFSLILIGGDSLNKPCCWPPELITAIQGAYNIQREDHRIMCWPIEK